MGTLTRLPSASVLNSPLAWRPGVQRLRRQHAEAVASFFGHGGYTGARHDRPGLREWHPSLGSADADTVPDLETLRANSRDLVRNAPLATGAINTHEICTIGTGLRPQIQIDRELLGLTEEQADAWERQAERIWWAVAATTDLDIMNRHTFAEQQAIAFRAVLESGDVFAIRRFKQRRDGLLGLKVQLVEADRCSNPDGAMDTPERVAGVEMDEDGAPIRYHFSTHHPGDYQFHAPRKWNAVPAFGTGTGERQVLHLFKALRPGQNRGVPILATVIEKIKQIDRYTDAEIARAVTSSLFTVFIKTLAGEDEEGLAAMFGEDQGTAVDVKREVRLGQGTVVDLAPGEDVEFADPTSPNDKLDPFLLAISQQIGVGLNLPREILMKHFMASYSASRAAILEAWRAFLTSRFWFASRFNQHVYEWAVSEAIMRGMLRAPGFFRSPLIRRAWLGVEWVGPSQGQIEPLREINAAEKRIDLGISTRQEETAAMTGGNWERKHAQRVKEERMRREDGLAGAAVTTEVEENADDVDEE